MSAIKEILLKGLNIVDDKLDLLKHRLETKLKIRKDLQIVAYRGFGNEKEFYVKGRVLKDKGVKLAEENETVLKNILSMYRRFNTDEMPFAKVSLEFLSIHAESETDKEGYFEFLLPVPPEIVRTRAWHTAKIQLPDFADENGLPVSQEANITVLKSDAASLLKAARMVFLNNARTRLPFEGVSAFYRALQSGPDSSLFNPIFYVSSSPWNLYDLLVDFFSLNGIPKGPLMLRDIGLTENHLYKSNHLEHKMDQIQKILSFYPDLPFILIGDSGQKDPEIYQEVVNRFPGRVKVIYIRDVGSYERDETVNAIARQILKAGVEMILVADTEAASLHAARNGFIDSEVMPEVKAEKAFDEKEPEGAEKVVDKISDILDKTD
jgi:phosphatidate phosphatase APP1